MQLTFVIYPLTSFEHGVKNLYGLQKFLKQITITSTKQSCLVSLKFLVQVFAPL
jgi:hypothetical protein